MSSANRHYLKGRYYWNKRTVEGFQRAVDEFTRAIEIDPRYARAHAGLADTYVLLGMARAQKGGALTNHPTPRGVVGWLHGLAGQRAQAHAPLERLEALAADNVRVSSYDIALVWLGLRDVDRTFAALNRAIDERSTLMTFAGILPWFDPLRDDPRFDALLGRLGLAKAAPRLVMRCFGSFTVSRAGVPVEFPTRRSRALLAYLAASGGHWHTRESLAALLWPDSGAEAARKSLRQERSTLRALVGDAALEVEADRVRLAPGGFSSDLQQVESARPTGEFLEDISALTDPFDEWLIARRREYRDAALATLESQLTRAERDKRSANAIRLAQ